MKPPSLPILQGIYPDRPKDSEIHFDTLAPSAEKPPLQETLQKRKRKSTKEENVHTNPRNELVINAEEEKGEEEGRKIKQSKNKTKNEWTW